MMQCDFPIALVLSFITGHLFVQDRDHVDSMAEFLLGSPIDYTNHDVCSMIDEHIFNQHPHLRAIIASKINENITPENCQEKLARVELLYGPTVTLLSMVEAPLVLRKRR